MKKILKICDWIEEGLAAIALIVMTVITFVNVIARYLFSASLSFSDEVTTYLFVLLSLLGTAIAAKRRAHLGLTILTDIVNPKVRKVLLLIGYGIAVIFSAAIFYYGILMVKNQILLGQTTPAMQWPEWIYGSFVPFGAFFVVIRFFQAFVEEAKNRVIRRKKHDSSSIVSNFWSIASYWSTDSSVFRSIQCNNHGYSRLR